MCPRCTSSSLKALVLCIAIVAARLAHAQAPSADETLRRAGEYGVRFIDALSNVVAEETYTQEVTRPQRTRTLRSDFLLVRYPGAAKWHAFRDVLEVDGQPVQENRQQRLTELFLRPADDALLRAMGIARVDERHHLTHLDVYNNPLLALSFLQPEDRSRFRFYAGRL